MGELGDSGLAKALPDEILHSTRVIPIGKGQRVFLSHDLEKRKVYEG